MSRRDTPTSAYGFWRDPNRPYWWERFWSVLTGRKPAYAEADKPASVYAHADNCDWWTDQYPWECSCGAIGGSNVE